MSEHPEALRLADELCEPVPDYHAPTSLEEASATELRRQHDEIEALKAERDRAHRACEQISVRLHAAQAERDALLTEVERLTSVCLDLTGQLMVLRATKQMTAAIDALKVKP